MEKRNPNNIFVDTNVLIGAYCGREDDTLCLRYLYALKGKRLFVSSLSIAQLVSVFQKTKGNAEIKRTVRSISAKFDILSFTAQDIELSLRQTRGDMEDNIQYVISQKMKCFYFVTNNYKDYSGFQDIHILLPRKVRFIRP